jgi:hypothetical protein
VRLKDHSIWNAREAISQNDEIYSSILAAIVNTQERHHKKFPSAKFHAALEKELMKEGWQGGISFSHGAPKFHFFQKRMAIQIRLRNSESFYSDYLQFLAAYGAHAIDVGILITVAKSGFRRVLDDLTWVEPSLTVPIWLIGLK